MIYETLDFLRRHLNDVMVHRFPTSRNWVTLSPLTQADGGVPKGLSSKLCLSLINIERDATASGTGPRMVKSGDTMVAVAPTLALNLDVLISAHFEAEYGDGLKLLSGAIEQFQSKPHFNAKDDGTLPAGVEKLSVEWVDLSLQEIFNIWTVLGGRYVPSALYKVRMLPVMSKRGTDKGKPVISTDVKALR